MITSEKSRGCRRLDSIRIVLLIAISLCHLSCEGSGSGSGSGSAHPKTPPLPLLPIPTARQIQWQLAETAIFFHFGTNTFTDREWGTGQADPWVFNPIHLNASQWISSVKESGFSRVILTAKHHDGFCLWPSDYTDYSVESTPWRNGTGDVVRDLAEAARTASVELGLYLSPWDRHESCYGKTVDYNEFYLAQMTELLTRYGHIGEVFLDGAKGEGEKDMEYLFPLWYARIHQLQPSAIIFSDTGPDARWVGDETGVAGTTCWSLFNKTYENIDARYAGEGDQLGQDWVPAECDVSIRPGWFWHPSEAPKSALHLLDIYYKSVGRNCLLLLNVPPNSSGLISPQDIQVLHEFARIRTAIFSDNLAKNASVFASSTRDDYLYTPDKVLSEGLYSYWAPDEEALASNWVLYLNFDTEITFNVLLLQEPIQMGQRIFEFHLDVLNDKGDWEVATNGTTVGYKRLLLHRRLAASRLRLVVEKSRADPLISYLGLYLDSFSPFEKASTSRFTSGNVTLQQTTERNLSVNSI